MTAPVGNEREPMTSISSSDKIVRANAARKFAKTLGRFAVAIEWLFALNIITFVIAALTGEISWWLAIMLIVGAIVSGELIALAARSAQWIITVLIDIEDNTRIAAESAKFTADEYRKQLDL